MCLELILVSKYGIKVEKDFLSMSSLKSWVYEEDIGKMCAFLISEDALRISGQIIGVNGNEIRLD